MAREQDTKRLNNEIISAKNHDDFLFTKSFD